MTNGEKLFNVLANARTQSGGKLTKAEWVVTADKFLDSLKPAKAPRRTNVLGKGLTDEQWFAELAKDPDLTGVDIPDEARKCRLWTRANTSSPLPTRRRVLKWLIKAEPKSVEFRAAPVDLETEPPEWRGTAQQMFPNTPFADEVRDGLAWGELSRQMRADITRRLP